MPKSAKSLLIGSTESHSGKSATALGVAYEFQKHGVDIAYGKPLGTCYSQDSADGIDEDVRLLGNILDLPDNRIKPTLLALDAQTIDKRLRQDDTVDYRQSMRDVLTNAGEELVLLEGPGTLDEGSLFGLSLSEIADIADASVLLVTRFHSVLLVDALLSAQQRLGDRLIGVAINDIPEECFDTVQTQIATFLESQGIAVLSLMPRNDLLRSVSVRELVGKLEAQVLCCRDRLDLMVESLQIGAMSVNSAVKYFQRSRNMAIVTGGDRTDIQLAALETSTHCLILTGHMNPPPKVLERAEEAEIPVISVDLDTLKSVEIIDRAFGQVRLHEPSKVECIRQSMAKYFDFPRLMGGLGLELAGIGSSD